MFRYVIGILILVGLGYGAYSYWQGYIEEKKEENAQEARREALKTSVKEIATKANAVTNWATILAGDKRTRKSPVFNAELQKLWVIDRPILFIGDTKDVAINQDGTYQVIVEFEGYTAWHRFPENTIRVSLQCPVALTTPIIQAAKSRRASGIGADTAMVGIIERIVTTLEGSRGQTITVHTGVGKCVNALYLGADYLYDDGASL